MAQEKTLSIALGSEYGLHTCVWNVKVDKSDVYISSQSTTGRMKASLHESGQCQYSFTSEFWKGKNLPNCLRHKAKWTIDTSITALIAFSVKFARQDFFKGNEEQPSQKIEWVTDLPKTDVYELLFIITPPNCTGISLNNMIASKSPEAFTWQLSNGKWLIVTLQGEYWTPEKEKVYSSAKKEVYKFAKGSQIKITKTMVVQLLLNNSETNSLSVIETRPFTELGIKRSLYSYWVRFRFPYLKSFLTNNK